MTLGIDWAVELTEALNPPQAFIDLKEELHKYVYEALCNYALNVYETSDTAVLRDTHRVWFSAYRISYTEWKDPTQLAYVADLNFSGHLMCLYMDMRTRKWSDIDADQAFDNLDALVTYRVMVEDYD